MITPTKLLDFSYIELFYLMAIYVRLEMKNCKEMSEIGYLLTTPFELLKYSKTSR